MQEQRACCARGARLLGLSNQPRRGTAMDTFSRKTALALCALTMTGAAACGDLTDEDLVSNAAALGDGCRAAAPTTGTSPRSRRTSCAERQLEDGLGPIFNETQLRRLPPDTARSAAPASNIERRYGRLTTACSIRWPTAAARCASCSASARSPAGTARTASRPLDVEAGRGDRDLRGRVTTPLFGLGLVDALPDSAFDTLAAASRPRSAASSTASRPCCRTRDAAQSIGRHARRPLRLEGGRAQPGCSSRPTPT